MTEAEVADVLYPPRRDVQGVPQRPPLRATPESLGDTGVVTNQVSGGLDVGRNTE